MIKVLELFGGIGAPRQALQKLGIDFEVVDYVEIDKYAVKSYNAIYNENFEPQDIMKWDKDLEVDLIFHGSPCQDFSIAGKGKGGDEGSGTRSSLLYETIRIVEKIKPKYVIWENVKAVLNKNHKHNFDNYLEKMKELGYTNYYQILNAKDYGIPQNRERVFTVSILGNSEFDFPPKQELKLRLKDMLEYEVDEKYYLSSETISKLQSYGYEQSLRLNDINKTCETINTMGGGHREPKIQIKEATKQGYKEAYDRDSVNLEQPNSLTERGVVETYVGKKYKEFEEDNGYVPEMFNPYNKSEIKDIAPTQSTQCGSTTSSATVLFKDNLRIRKLTPKECFRLMGFDDADFDKASQVNSNAQLYKQAGNSIVVNVLMAIFGELFDINWQEKINNVKPL